MCGIVAAISKNGRPVPRQVVARMSDDIIHRGPDDHGFWFSYWCGLGARRLSILDLSEHGHQPMLDPTGTYLIVYNGEVYNFSALREELQHEGVAFRSSSDTEVVLQSYIRWGEDSVNRLLGMFAFIIVNIPRREVFIARDQLGIKPLYYHESKDFFFVASEIKALRHVVAFELNHDVLYEQFAFRYVAGESTPFKNIYKFPPGAYWSLTPGGARRTYQYYDVTRSLRSNADIDEETCLRTSRAAVIDSIKAHTASDVGYAVQLSGGVDSSLITATLSRELGHRLKTFSIVIPGAQYDESQFQRAVSERYRTDHQEMEVGDRTFAEALEKATWHMDVPIVHLGCVLLMLLCQQSARTSKVILTGEGADELFAGYNRHLTNANFPFGNGAWLGPLLKRLNVNPRILPPIQPIRRYKSQLALKLIDSQRTLKRPIMESFLDGLPENTPYRDQVVESQDGGFLQGLAHDQACYLASLLDRQDKMSMAASVEARVPFCNPQLFDLVNPMSTELKLKGDTTKYLLKKIAEEYLDRAVLYRRKNGLNIPIEEWTRQGPLADQLTLLTDQTARERGFYNHRAIVKAVDQQRSGKGNFGRYLAAILMFEIWMRMFIDGGAAPFASSTPAVTHAERGSD